MLKLIDKLLSPELPRALRAMGHGDSVAIAASSVSEAKRAPEDEAWRGIWTRHWPDERLVIDATNDLRGSRAFFRNVPIASAHRMLSGATSRAR